MPTLADTQRTLWRLITAPEGVASALRPESDPDGALREALGRTVRSDTRLGAADRVDIYANMYFFRLRDAIKDDYPAVAAVLGEATFHNLITDYLLVHVPTHPSLRDVGAPLPGFLRTHRAGLESPFLADLAAFEWALVDAFDERDEPVLAVHDLAAVPPDRWGRLRFRLHPSVRLLRADWPVQRIWSRVDRGERAGAVTAAGTILCVWRQDLRVTYREVDALEGDALLQVAAGARFGEICAAISEAAEETEAAARLAGFLSGWVRDGVLAAVDGTVHPHHGLSG